jgi:N-acetylmuramoyl-L-alanine amidase
MPNHEVEQGDCITSISQQYGFFWDTIWNHADNAELKELRKDPNALLAGDVVVIPDKRQKEESCATEEKHKFKLKGVPAKLKIRLMLDDLPRKNEPYRLSIDHGPWIEGTTDGDGFLEQPLPPGAMQGILKIGTGLRVDEYKLALGTLDPIDTDSGIKGRLHGLGYHIEGDDMGPALSAFQKKEQLTVTGTADDQTRDLLKQRFGQ